VPEFGDDEEAELLGIEDVAVAIYGEKCGGLDADALVRVYEEMFIGLGGEVMYNTEATKLILRPVEELELPGEPFVWQDTVVSGAETSKGEILAEKTVVAAGAWAQLPRPARGRSSPRRRLWPPARGLSCCWTP